jgi:hypothetical protein
MTGGVFRSIIFRRTFFVRAQYLQRQDATWCFADVDTAVARA